MRCKEVCISLVICGGLTLATKDIVFDGIRLERHEQQVNGGKYEIHFKLSTQTGSTTLKLNRHSRLSNSTLRLNYQLKK